jgi:hypothetical protein
MKSIDHLEFELTQAKEHNLIESFEHIQNRDCILVKLKENTNEKTCQQLKMYIRDTYKEVMYVTLTPYERALYIRYVI